jgi:hypothetical protein
MDHRRTWATPWRRIQPLTAAISVAPKRQGLSRQSVITFETLLVQALLSVNEGPWSSVTDRLTTEKRNRMPYDRCPDIFNGYHHCWRRFRFYFFFTAECVDSALVERGWIVAARQNKGFQQEPSRFSNNVNNAVLALGDHNKEL